MTRAAELGPRASSAIGWVRAWETFRYAAVAVVLVAGAWSSPAPDVFRLPWPGSVLDVASFLALFVLVADLFARGWVRPPTPVLLLAALSIVLGIVSIAWTTTPSSSRMFAVNSAQALVLLWMMQAVLRGASPRAVVAVIGGWVVALLIPCALLWAEVPGYLPPSTLDPTSGDYISYFARLSHPWIGRSNNIAVLLVVPVIPLAIWGVRHRNRWAQATAGLALVATVMTLSRGTLLALAVGVVLLLILARREAASLWRWVLGALAASAVAVVLMFLLNPASREHMASRASATNIDARGDLLAEALAAIRAYPLRGQGPAVTPSFHNIVVQQLVDFGIVLGLLVNVLLVAVVLWWWLGRRQRETRWLAVACGVAVAVQLGSCLVEASYEGGFLRNLMWLSWGLLLALYAAEHRSERDHEQETVGVRPGATAESETGTEPTSTH